METYIIKCRNKRTGETRESNLLNTKEEAQGWVERMNQPNAKYEYWYETLYQDAADVPF